MEPSLVLQEVERAFPFVEKPRRELLAQYNDGNFETRDMLLALDACPGPQVSPQIVRAIYGDLAELSALGFSWVLPSFLRVMIASTDTDDITTEFFIYSLGGLQVHEESARTRCSLLTPEQIKCLLTVLRYWENHKHWSQYCAEEIRRAQAFVVSLRPNQALQVTSRNLREAKAQITGRT